MSIWQFATFAIIVFMLLLVVPACSGEKYRNANTLSGGAQEPSPFVSRRLLGLFTHDVASDIKGKVPSSEWSSIRNVRIYVHWNEIEKSRGKYSWGKTDAQVNAALSLGANSIFMTLGGGLPKWAQNPSSPGNPGNGLPKDLNWWKDFCKKVAQHYRGYVDYYQIWQEPGWDLDAPPSKDGVIYFSGHADQDYLGLLRAGYYGIKEGDPSAYVMTGSLLDGLTRQPSDYVTYETLLAGREQDVSMKVESKSGIVAERPMYFNYKGVCPGGTVESGVVSPGRSWYLAEGATQGGFEEWICIQNPGSQSSGVTITYMFPGGETQAQSFNVKPHSRTTVNVNGAVGTGKDVSAKIEATRPIVVERPMYFNYKGKWTGGSVETGVPGGSNTWYLAEGTTREGFEQWISLMNPNSQKTSVELTYMFNGGGTQKQTLEMLPTSRSTILVNRIVGSGKDVSTKITSELPIIVERPMYFDYHGILTGGHTEVGSTKESTSWFLCEGTTRKNSADGTFEEWISIQNPGDTSAKIQITYMFPGGATQGGKVEVSAHSRYTINVNREVGDDRDVSAKLVSNVPIIVERPMYFNYHNIIGDGTVELGNTQAQKTWYFAEGTTRSGFEEWLTLQNPNTLETEAKITFMFGDGTTQQRSFILPANSRTTVSVNNSISMAAVCDGVAVNPYHWPQYWAEYYSKVKEICERNGYGSTDVVVSEIGWPNKSELASADYSEEGQRQAIGEVGLGGLFSAGCSKIWIYQDLDEPPGESWDQIYDGLFGYQGKPHPAWYEYKKWQQQLPTYPNKPARMSEKGSNRPNY
ncbi:MAG: hypothetical protein PHP64_07610 [Actinomycetota bacterium]|nr:hypothetical protein [Actinomycetota bacterium]